MTLNEIKRIQADICNRIYALTETDEGSNGIIDGIMDIDEYFSREVKLLWLLKETHDDKGDYFLGDSFKKIEFSNNIEKHRMFRNMVYISFSLLNGLIPYKDLPFIKECDEMRTVMNKIAYINIKKTAGKSISNDRELKMAYEEWKEILLLQIQTCRPNIVIFGGTLKYYQKDLNLNINDFIRNEYCQYCKKDNIIYISALHPSYPYLNEEEYRADLINAVIKAKDLVVSA